jgi:regulator of sigma E protease
VGRAIARSGERFTYLTWETIKLPLRVFDAEKRKDISGVVGSYEVTRQTILSDISQVVVILSVISLSLAVVNLFPFLPLDGGHIFWAIVEKIRGRPVSYALMERSSVVGFMLVMGLFVLGLSNDISRLTGEGFQVR